MGEIFQSGEFWLPPEFFTGDGILADEPNKKPTSIAEIDFPANLGSYNSSSYSLSSSAFSSPVESVLGSTETDSDDEDESVAESTRWFTESRFKPNQTVRACCTWDLSCADVATQDGKMMKMNGVDEEIYKGTCHVAPQSGPLIGRNRSPLAINHCASFYANQFPFNQVKPNPSPIPSQVINQNYGFILGRPSIDLLHRQIQLQQQLMSQRRSRVLNTNQLNENAYYDVYSSLNLPYLATPYPFGVHQMNKMSTGDSLGIFERKQTCAGTGVFIPRPNLPVAGRYIARNPPKLYQSVNKTSTLITAQPSNAPLRDTFAIGPSAIPTQIIPGLQLDSLVKHEQCLPQEWSY